MLFAIKKIRRDLLNDNKVIKYLIYAIGEIVLVVAGILIALSIDNWTQERKDLVSEQNVLNQLAEEFAKNLDQLNEKMLMRNQMISSASGVLNYIDYPSLAMKDSLLFHLGIMMRDPTFDPIVNDLVSGGYLRLIRNDTLRHMLSNWTTDVHQLQELELEWQKVRREVLVPFSINAGIFRDISHLIWKDGYTPVEALDQNISIQHKIKFSKKSPPLYDLLNDKELEGIAAMTITWNHLANIQSHALLKRMNTIQSLIAGEIVITRTINK